jgi:pimeloyl-ACP methyl ester carboxylesterase
MSASATAPEVQRGTLLAGGTRTRLLQAGPVEASEAVVFVHGNPGSADDWERLVGAVGAIGRRAISLDLPDFGETVAPKGFEHDIYGYAGFLGEALEELGVERAHLVMHDFGGPIGLAWALAHPEAVASVIEIDTGFVPGYRWHFFARVWQTPGLGELVQAVTTRTAFRLVHKYNEPRGLPREFVDQMYDHYDRRTRRAVLKLYRATPHLSAMSELLTRVFASRNIPALVIWGEGDPYLPSSFALRQHEAFPSADVHVLPASGHWPYVDAPDTVERLLTEFLTELS